MELTKDWVAKYLPARPKDANKGTFGKVLVFAGSENFPGAAYLACTACYRVGAGLVTLATEESVKIIVARKIPEVTFLSFDEVVGKVSKFNVLLIGPGLGQSNQAAKLMEDLLNNNLPPAVIDGDGLNILSKMSRFFSSKIGEWWGKLGNKVILTPHPGEMARLTGLTVKKIQSDRINVAQYYAKKWNKIVVLKGANTVVSSPTGKVKISPFANPVLATAGTGDILSGVIAGMLAQGLKPFEASCVGVYLHGLAGEMLGQEVGNAGSLASDFLPLLPQAIKQLKIKK